MKKTIIASLLLTVCSMASVMASPYAPVSKEDMQAKYKGLPLAEFLKRHYWEEVNAKPLNKVGNAVGRFFDKMSQSRFVTPNPYYHASVVNEGYDPVTGSVIFAAIFNPVNYNMLYTPAADLKTFCEINNGYLRPVHAETQPENLALDVANSVPMRPSMIVYGEPFYTLPGSINYILDQEELDRFRAGHLRYAVLIEQAINAQAIGPVACVGEDSKAKWMAKIEPVAYEYMGAGEHNAQVALRITPVSVRQ